MVRKTDSSGVPSANLTSSKALNSYPSASSFSESEELASRLADLFTMQRASSSSNLDTSTRASEGSQRNGRHAANSLITEIYFNPVDATRSTVALSSPLNSPLITPTQESFAAGRQAVLVNERRSPESPSAMPPALSSENLDCLVKALTNAPLMQKHIKMHSRPSRKDEPSAAPETSSETGSSGASPVASLSLSNGISEVSTCSDSNTSFSVDEFLASLPPEGEDTCVKQSPTEKHGQKNNPARGRPVSTISDGILRSTFESIFQHQMNVDGAPRAQVRALKLVDLSADGSPVIMVSKDHYLPATGGFQELCKCSDIKLPEGVSIDRSLLSIDNSPNEEQARVVLRLVVPAVQRKTGKKNRIAIVEIDVTESFTKAALFELIQHSAQEGEYEITSLVLTEAAVKRAIEAFATLRRESCTMQTLVLMSELDRITGQFRDFHIVRIREMHDTGFPARLAIPWASQSLIETLAEHDARDLRELVVGIVAKRSIGGVAFTSRIDWDGDGKRMHCVPLITASEYVTPTTWICFARDGFDIGYW